MVARYCRATKRDGVPQLDWYFAYNLFRLTGIVQGIKKRIVDGTASSAQAAKTAERACRGWRRPHGSSRKSGRIGGKRMSQFDLTGKVAIITGSSKGIGKASAFELAEHGAKVVISSRKQDACDTVAAEINAQLWRRHRDRRRRQHLRQGRAAEPGRRNPPRRSAGSMCSSATPRRTPITARRKGLRTTSSARSSTTTSSPITG